MNPAELARSFAEAMMIKGVLTESEDEDLEMHHFHRLNRFAEVLGLLNRPYIVQTDAALALPDPEGPPKPFRRLSEVNFMGEFKRYDIVSSPKAMGRLGINALCLNFEDFILLSEPETAEWGRLQVPATSVSSMDKLAA